MNNHLPYHILLAITVVAVTVMAAYHLALRRTGFGVNIQYRLPEAPPPSASEPAPLPPPPWEEEGAATPPPTPSQQEAAEEEAPEPEASVAPPPEPEQPEQPQPVVLVQFPLELNAATYEELLHIPRVGHAMATRIVQYREHLGGRYTSLEQLLDISGVGEQTYGTITAYLYLAEED